MPGFTWVHIQIKQQLKNFVRQSGKLNTEHVKELSNFRCGNDIIIFIFIKSHYILYLIIKYL